MLAWVNKLLVDSGAKLTEAQKDELKRYKYAGSDNSILLKYFYTPVLEWGVNKVPLFTAPNLITLMGFCFVTSACLLTLVTDHTFQSPPHPLVYLYNGLAIWAYQWLDNLDGKQARRTKTSSAFGELFDHGVDAYAATCASVCYAGALQLGTSPMILLVPFLVYFPFFAATWEQYWVGSMDLGPVNGAMEGTFSLVVLHFLGFLTGGAFFGGPSLLQGVSVGWMLTGVSFIMAIACVSTNIWKVVEKANAQGRMSEALAQTTSLWVVLVCSGVMGIPLSNDQLLHNGLAAAYILVTGLAFGHLGTNLTLAHLSKTPFPSWFHLLVVPVALAVCNTTGFMRGSAALAWCGFAVLALHTIVYKYILIYSLLDTLDINFLTLTDSQRLRLIELSAPLDTCDVEDEETPPVVEVGGTGPSPGTPVLDFLPDHRGQEEAQMRKQIALEADLFFD